MLTLEFEEHRTNEQGKEQFEEYDWWKELVRKAAEKADSFQLRCWEDEKEGIAFGEKFGTKQESSTKELVFTGTVTEQMMDELTENCVGSDGCLKYFTIAFIQEISLFLKVHTMAMKFTGCILVLPRWAL